MLLVPEVPEEKHELTPVVDSESRDVVQELFVDWQSFSVNMQIAATDSPNGTPPAVFCGIRPDIPGGRFCNFFFPF